MSDIKEAIKAKNMDKFQEFFKKVGATPLNLFCMDNQLNVVCKTNTDCAVLVIFSFSDTECVEIVNGKDIFDIKRITNAWQEFLTNLESENELVI